MADKKAAPGAQSPQEVERIRDIIFGSQMRDYDRRFEETQRDLGRIRESLDQLSARVSELDTSVAAKVEDLRGEGRQTEDSLRDELRAAKADLSASKVDREQLAQLFALLASQLQGGASLDDVLAGLEGADADA